MIYLIIIGILLLNLAVINISSKCSHIEEKMYFKEFKKDITNK